MTREARSFCRICPGYCGVILTIDSSGDRDEIVRVRGDHDHPMSDGFACIKGIQSAHLYHGPQRLLHPLKRTADGGFERISIAQALDEIGAKMAEIRDRDGPDAIALFKGGNVYQNTLPSAFMASFQAAIGTSSLFTNSTIDQSAKMVSADRLGSWHAGRNYFAAADVTMLIGGNPLVSIAMFGFDAYNPVKKLKAYKARGGKLIVIDPRRTETAQFADIFLQPRPGEDVTLAAGMLHIALAEGWHDRAFCERHMRQMEELRRAVEPFTPDYVARRTDVPADLLRQTVEVFARSKSGFLATGTGPNMSPRSNLSQHLFDALDMICGHVLREGARVPNPGLMRKRDWRAQVIPPGRGWEKGPKSRIRGLGMLFGEKMTGALADEIMTPGEGQVKALFVDGGNPASSICDQRRIVEAMQSLELMVTVDPEMTATARLAHYILPPKLQYEHPNMTGLLEAEASFHARPSQQFVEAAIRVPPNSELVDDWRVYFELARRLGLQLSLADVPLDMQGDPEPEDMFRLLFREGNVTFDEIRRHPGGYVFDIEDHVLPAEPGCDARFEPAPPDVVQELAEVWAEPFGAVPTDDQGRDLPLLLISRRLREVFNSAGRTSPAVRARQPYNAAYVHPDQLSAYGLAPGDAVTISSDNGAIPAIVAADATLRMGVVSMAHGWGGLPDEDSYETDGANVGLLVSTQRHVEKINAMPRQSAIPVRLDRKLPG